MRFAENEGVEAPGSPPILFANSASHWWDGSEVYGGNERDRAGRCASRAAARTCAWRTATCRSARTASRSPGSTRAGGWASARMHTLFAREHNAVCDALRAEYPTMSEERIYHTARLVVSALIAKIHTVEWTPAILATEAIDTRAEHQLVGPAEEVAQPARPVAVRGALADRHPEDAAGPPRRAVLADRGLRRPSTACTR